MSEKIHIGPQAGPQTAFLSTPADIAIYGGSAGGGKSFALLLEPMRHTGNPEFGGIIFRRTSTQVRIEGGLWDESEKLYGAAGAAPRESQLEWDFPSQARMKFASLEYDKDVYNFQGAQIAYIGFDELTHFTRKQFMYMLTRNRSSCGVSPYMRATTNPDADSWVRSLIDWWIDEKTGFPIMERSGIVRWFIVKNEQMIWGDSKEQLEKTYGIDSYPKSLTFIPAKLQDNKILMAANPEYIANLNAQSRVERMRLLEGNWNVRATAGMMFQRQWFPVIDALPPGHSAAIRFWDRAATRPSPENSDPDWTRGLKLLKYPNNTYVVADIRSLRDSPGQVEKLIRDTAAMDGKTVTIMSQQDPGSAGKAEAVYFARMLSGYKVETETMPTDKITRAKPVSAQVEVGNVSILRAPWNAAFLDECENFPEGGHDDQVDTLSGAFNRLANKGKSIIDFC